MHYFQLRHNFIIKEPSKLIHFSNFCLYFNLIYDNQMQTNEIFQNTYNFYIFL